MMADASSEARNAKAAAISSGRTRRRIGTRSNEPLRYSISFGPTAFSVISVCVKPGETPLTRMPCWRELQRHRAVEAEQRRPLRRCSSRTSRRHRWRRSRCCAGSRRRPVSRMERATCCDIRNDAGEVRPDRPRASVSSAISRNGVSSSTPALLISTSMRSQRSERRGDRPPHVGSDRDTSAVCGPRRVRHQRGGLLQRLARAPDEEQLGALAGEAGRDRAPDAAAGAGDDHALPVEAPAIHPFTAPAVSPRMKNRWPKM